MTTTRQAFYKYIHTSNTLQVFVGGKPLSAPATNVGVVNAASARRADQVVACDSGAQRRP